MKMIDFVSVTRNKRTNQTSLHLKSRKLKEKGLTPKEILEMSIPMPKEKFLGDFKK